MRAKIIMNEIKRDGGVYDSISVGNHAVLKAFFHAVENYPKRFTDVNDELCIFSPPAENSFSPWVIDHLHIAAKELNCAVEDLLWIRSNRRYSFDQIDLLDPMRFKCKNDMISWVKTQFLESECITVPLSVKPSPAFSHQYYTFIINPEIRAVKALNEWERMDNHISFATSDYYVQYR